MGDAITPKQDASEHVHTEPLKVEGPAGDMQNGVRVAEAVARSWTKKSLIVVYIW